MDYSRFIDYLDEHVYTCGINAINANLVDTRYHDYNTIIFLKNTFAPRQWETSLQSNAVSHWLGTNLESALSSMGTKSNSYPTLPWHLISNTVL